MMTRAPRLRSTLVAGVVALSSVVTLASPAFAANETVTVTVNDADFPPPLTVRILDRQLDVRAIQVNASGAQLGTPGSVVEALAIPNGQYQFSLPPGSWKIEAVDNTWTSGDPDQYARTWSGNAKSFAEATVITTDGVAGGADTTIAMPQGGSLRVITQSDVGNELIGNICATVYDAVTTFPIASVVNPGGSSVTIKSLAPGNYKVQLAAASFIQGDCSASTSYAPEFYLDQTNISNGTAVAVTVGTNNTIQASLAPLATDRTISGNVTRNGGGALQAIKVTAVAVGGGAVTASTTTNLAGSYTLPVSAGTYKVRFEDFDTSDGVQYATEWWNDKATQTLADIVDVSAANRSGVSPALDVAGGITGTVTSADGADAGTAPDPVAGATVAVFDGSNAQVSSTTTAANGTYSIVGLFPNTYRMRVTPPTGSSLATEWYQNKSDFATATLLTVSSGQTRTAIDTFLDAASSISGTVTGPNSARLSGVCVAAYTPGGSFSGRTTTTVADDPATVGVNEAGNYLLTGLSMGDYRLRFSHGDDANCPNTPAPNWASKWYPNSVNHESAGNITLGGGTVAGRNITLVDGAGNLSGKATKTGGNADNVCVRVYDNFGQILRERATDASGNWVVGGLAPQTVRVEYRPDLQPGDNCFTTDADKLGGTGIATDQGPPAAGALANRFYLDKLTLAEATPRNMVADQPSSGVNQFLPAASTPTSNTGDASISGIVREPDGNTTRLLEGVCVAAVALDWNGEESTVVATSAPTGADGAFTIPGLARDRLFKIRFTNDPALGPVAGTANSCGGTRTGFNTTQWYTGKSSFATGNAVRTNANGSTVTGINATLAFAGVISGVISDAETGTGLAAVIKVYNATDGSLVRQVKTATNGTYKVGSLPVGTYKVGIEPVDANFQAVFHQGAANLASATVITVGNSTNSNVSAALKRNHAPIAGDDSVTVKVNTPTVLDSLTSNDVDEDGDPVKITFVGTPTHGTAVLGSDGRVTYTSKQDSFETDTFTYTVSDVSGLQDQATVTVTVVGELVGAPPVAADDEAFTPKNTAVSISPLANDLDPDGDEAAMTLTAVGTPFHGTATISGKNVVYTPAQNFAGIDQFTYTVKDSQGFTDIAKITVNVASPTDNAVDSSVAAGGTVGTNGTSASPTNNIITSVTSPNAGDVQIVESQGTEVTGNGMTTIAPRVDITAPAATAGNPLTITFRLDGSVLEGTIPQRAIRVLRNGTLIGDCLGSLVANPDPCLSGHQRVGDDLLLTVRTSRASTWTFGFLDEAVVDRAAVQGAGRIDTAVRISRQVFSPDEVTTVVIARADTYPDALAGAPLARQLRGPLLLTNSNSLDVITRDEIRRLGASRIVILGGRNAVSTNVENSLRALSGVQTVERIAGNNRFETAAKVAGRLNGFTSAYVVEGSNVSAARGWPDAVSVASLAAFQGRPILLVERDVLPAATRQVLQGLTSAIVVGGPGAVSNNVVIAIDNVVGTVGRYAGNSRYETNYQVALAARNAGMSVSSIWIATGNNFPDALAAGAAVAKEGGLLLLVDGNSYANSPRVRELLTTFRDQIESVTIAGGTGAVSAVVEAQIRQSTTT